MTMIMKMKKKIVMIGDFLHDQLLDLFLMMMLMNNYDYADHHDYAAAAGVVVAIYLL